MKKLKIAINISLIVKLLLWIGLAVLIYFLGTEEAGKAAQQASESVSETSVIGGVVGGSAAAFAVILVTVLELACIAVPVVFTIIIIIRYNVFKRVTLALGIITIIFSCITAGILMLIQRSKMHSEVEEK